MIDVRLTKSRTPKPDENRAERAVVQDRERIAQLQQSLAAIPHRIAALEATI